MKYGYSDNVHIDELSAMRILREVRDKALKEKDGKVHVREIKNGHIGKMIERY